MTADIRPMDADQMSEAAELAAQVYRTGRIGEVFSDRSATISRWKWLARNPMGGAPAWVALERGRVIGHVGIIPVIIVSAGHTVRAAWARDLLVHPDARGMGLGSDLIRTAAAASGNLLLGGLNPIVRRMYRRLGYTDMGAIPLLVRPQAVGDLARAFRWTRPVAGILELAEQAVGAVPLPRRRSVTETRVTPNLDERFDDWWGRTESSLGCVVRRTAETMIWRYKGHPAHEYTLIESSDHRGIRGVAVVRIGPSRAVRAGFVVEVLTHPQDGDATRDLVDAALEVLGESRPAVVRCNATQPWLRRALLRRAFIPRPSTLHWMRATSEDLGDDLSTCGEWTLNSGDSDLDAI